MVKKLSLVFSVLFLDFLTFSAVIAFLPLFFLDTPHSFFSSTFSLKLRYILLGIFTATYPIAQMIAAPFLGHLSDKIGRRGILLSSYIGNAAGYLFCCAGVLTHSVLPLFIGYFVAGLTGVNLSTTNAIISDVSINEKRSKFFAMSHLMLGVGFILGPWIAGRIVGATGEIFQTCFYLFVSCAVVSVINFLLILKFWSADTEKIATPKWTEVRLKDFMKCEKPLKTLLWAEFLVFFGWYFFIKTFQVFLVEKIGCSELQVFNIYSQYGLWFSLSQVAFILWLHKYSRSEKFFRGFIFLLAFSILALTLMNGYSMTCFIIPLFSFAYATLVPSLTALVSDYASSHNNGKVMGLHQSIQALAKVFGPVIAGILLTLTPLATVLFSPLFILASLGVLALGSRKEEIKVS
ncbi:MAG: MFS transporter [Rhabdochlamydiaceae bacterium]|jgi:DHA1 family tetracycline resistance protein-like MFS transporter